MHATELHLFDMLRIIKKEIKNKIFNIDINKCRKNILYYSKYKYPVFTVMDTVKEYNNEDIETGIYYIDSNLDDNVNITFSLPLNGRGWYSHAMIDYCLENNIITKANIKYVLKSSCYIEANYFNLFIHFCYNELDDKFKKLSVNMMIGNLKPNLEKREQ